MDGSVAQGKVDLEEAKVHGCPAARWWHEAHALWVDHWDDGQGHAGVWHVGTAGAPVVRALDFQEVFVGDMTAVARGLHSRHHEGVLW